MSSSWLLAFLTQQPFSRGCKGCTPQDVVGCARFKQFHEHPTKRTPSVMSSLRCWHLRPVVDNQNGSQPIKCPRNGNSVLLTMVIFQINNYIKCLFMSLLCRGVLDSHNPQVGEWNAYFFVMWIESLSFPLIKLLYFSRYLINICWMRSSPATCLLKQQYQTSVKHLENIQQGIFEQSTQTSQKCPFVPELQSSRILDGDRSSVWEGQSN